MSSSSGVDMALSPAGSERRVSDGEKHAVAGEKRPGGGLPEAETGSVSSGGKGDHTHRRLKPRHVQLIGIGGTIGTALFVQIGQGLLNGGPGSLFLAFTIWSVFILACTICLAEMVSYLPISSPFIRFAGNFVDQALGFAAGWNFFVFEAALVPFEVTACNLVIHFWSDAVPVGGIIAIVIFLYGLINLLAVDWYGETEFWAALGKVVLIVSLLLFTFIVMLGGNPLGDRFGFKFWQDPGAFAPLYYDGSLGRFLGFLQCLIQASFTIAGPDYVAMAAGEAEDPRRQLPRAFNTVFDMDMSTHFTIMLTSRWERRSKYRLTCFFVLGSLAVGILVPYDDKELKTAFANSAPGAAASPYVVAMNRLNIPVLPHIVNALVLTAVFSAGNSYVYCASRSLYGLALEGKAPRILARCTKKGVPAYSVLVVLGFALLSFLQVSNGAAEVLSWFVSLVTASQLINFAVICFTYIRFHRALAAQGVDRRSLPYRGWFQPYAAWFGLCGTSVMALIGGYTVFLPGRWNVPKFLFSYTMVGVSPVLFVGWKLVKRTKFLAPEEVDLRKNLADIEEYERHYVPQPSKGIYAKVLDFLFG